VNCTAFFEQQSEHVSVVEIKELPERPRYAKARVEVPVPLKPPNAPATVSMLNGDYEITNLNINFQLS